MPGGTTAAFRAVMSIADTARTNILTAIDYSEESTSVVEQAIAVAER
jgi:hypothetical protein